MDEAESQAFMRNLVIDMFVIEKTVDFGASGQAPMRTVQKDIATFSFGDTKTEFIGIGLR
jgi:hypothetical protein